MSQKIFTVVTVTLLFFFITPVNGQTLIKNWYGKNKEVLAFYKDTSRAEFGFLSSSSDTYQVRIDNASGFSLGEVSFKQEPIKDTSGEETKIKVTTNVEWYPFKIIKLSVDTLIIDYATSKKLSNDNFRPLIFFSRKRIGEINHPVFISLKYDRNLFHLVIDSAGLVYRVFDELNNSIIPVRKIIKGKLSSQQLEQLKYFCSSDDVQNLPEYFGSAADGERVDLTIESIPKNIHSYGTGLPFEIQMGLVRFILNIYAEMTHND